MRSKKNQEIIEAIRTDDPAAQISGDMTAQAVVSPPLRNSNRKKGMIIGIIVIAVVLVALIGIKALLGNNEGTNLPAVPTATAERSEIREEITVKGTIQGAETASVSSALSAEVISVNVKVGDVVKKGQVLATLKQETEDIAEQKRQEDLERQELQAQYDTTKIAADAAKQTLDSSKRLYDAGAISESEYLSAKNAHETQQITLDSIASRIANVGKKSSLKNSDQYIIKSPISGTVTRVNTNVGRSASSTADNQPMFVVEDLSRLQMKVAISEYDISSIQLGQEVAISAEMLGTQTVVGTVSDIAPTGELKNQTTTEMIIPVVIDVNKGDTNLMAGVTAKAVILIAKRENVITVPIDAILEDPAAGESFVFVVKKGTLKKVPVTIGLESNLYVEIASGNIKEGDKVVLAPSPEMRDGMKINTEGDGPDDSDGNATETNTGE